MEQILFDVFLIFEKCKEYVASHLNFVECTTVHIVDLLGYLESMFADTLSYGIAKRTSEEM